VRRIGYDRAVRFSIVLLIALLQWGCDNTSDCTKACKRVSRCRQEARVGEKMLGERDLPADARCMKRCTDQREEWEKCEFKHRTCAPLRNCYGPLR
jgi:hypothetical protein